MLDTEKSIIEGNQTLQILGPYPFGYSADTISTQGLSTPPAVGDGAPVPAAARAANITPAIAATQLVFTGQAPATVVGNSAFSVAISQRDRQGAWNQREYGAAPY